MFSQILTSMFVASFGLFERPFERREILSFYVQMTDGPTVLAVGRDSNSANSANLPKGQCSAVSAVQAHRTPCWQREKEGNGQNKKGAIHPAQYRLQGSRQKQMKEATVAAKVKFKHRFALA